MFNFNRFYLFFILMGSINSLPTDFGNEFFQLTLLTLDRLIKTQGIMKSEAPTQIFLGNSSLSRVHLLRIPKSSSTSLSIIARRMVGCNPPGPCCKYPGDPIGSCPSKDLFACELTGKVIGCTHHYPNQESLTNPLVASISMVREPLARSISAFFYPGIHHNSACTRSLYTQSLRTEQEGKYDRLFTRLQKCFAEYTADSRFQNIASKMFTGSYAYDARVRICEVDILCPGKSLQRALETLMLNSTTLVSSPGGNGKRGSLEDKHGKIVDEASIAGIKLLQTMKLSNIYPKHAHVFVGVSELWELSVLLLHTFLYKARQVVLTPLLTDFNAYDERASSEKHVAKGSRRPATRSNTDALYLKYREIVQTPSNLNLLLEQNKFDLILYRQALANMCREVHILGLDQLNIVQQYWLERAPRLPEPATRGNGIEEDLRWSLLDLQTCSYIPTQIKG
jgi:hypothetical protein